MEKFVICNSSPLDADITFSFLNDGKGETFLLDPPVMFLKPSERQVISHNLDTNVLALNHYASLT